MPPRSPPPPPPPRLHRWGLCGPTSREPGLPGADRFSPLPGNCKSCWLLLGADWGGQRREDQLSSMGRSWWGRGEPAGCVPGSCSVFMVVCGPEAPRERSSACLCPTWAHVSSRSLHACKQPLPELWLQEGGSQGEPLEDSGQGLLSQGQARPPGAAVRRRPVCGNKMCAGMGGGSRCCTGAVGPSLWGG